MNRIELSCRRCGRPLGWACEPSLLCPKCLDAAAAKPDRKPPRLNLRGPLSPRLTPLAS